MSHPINYTPKLSHTHGSHFSDQPLTAEVPLDGNANLACLQRIKEYALESVMAFMVVPK